MAADRSRNREKDIRKMHSWIPQPHQSANLPGGIYMYIRKERESNTAKRSKRERKKERERQKEKKEEKEKEGEKGWEGELVKH